MSHPVPDPKTKTLSGRRVLGLVAMLVGFLVVQACGQIDNPRTRSDQVSKARTDRQFQRFGERLADMVLSDSAARAAFSGLSASEVRKKTRELILFGVRRLNSKDQVRRVALSAGALNGVPDETCADAGLEMLALGLDSAGVEDFISFEFAAIQAEIRGTPPALPTDSTAVAWARQTIMSALTSAGRKIFSTEVHPSIPLTAAELCAVNRAIYGRISALPESQQPDYARAVATWVAARNN